MPKNDKESLFRGLTRLFRSGPIVKRRIKLATDRKGYQSSALDLFKRSQSHVYSNAINAYGQYDRMARYADFSEMEYTPEIASALDIYADEAVAQDDKGQSLHIFSNNPQILKILGEVFYDTLNIEFNLRPWIRNLVKYGDFFLFNDVSPEHGILNVFPIPVNEIEREEGFDPDDPLAVRYRWITQGNQVLENWQVTHLRLLGNDAFLPYGSSILEPARRIWRQLILIEDAMLVYRVVRSPERRIFYIDVGNVPPEDVPAYMEKAKTVLRSNQVIDKATGRVDLRYNPLSVDEDYFIPVRGSETGTRIDTLPGGTHISAIEDVEYIQKKLFAALKVPRAYLGYDEVLSSKATLAQEDIRFSRTINMIQRIVIAELNKIAAIHLYAHGFEGDDLLDFALHLSNPSTIAQQQKLELYRTRLEIAGTAPENLVDLYYLRKNIMGMTDDDIKKVEEGQKRDRQFIAALEAIGAGPEGGAAPGGVAGGGGEDLFAGQDREIDADPGEDLLTSNEDGDVDLLSGLEGDLDEAGEDDEPVRRVASDPAGRGPIRPNPQSTLARSMFNRRRRRTHGASQTHMPDFAGMVDIMGSDATDVYDRRSLGIDTNPLKNAMGEADELDGPSLEEVLDGSVTEFFRMNRAMQSLLKDVPRRKRPDASLGSDTYAGGRSILSETSESDEGEEIDLDLEIDEDVVIETDGEHGED